MAAVKNGTTKSVLEVLVAESSRRILRAMAAAAGDAKAEWTLAAEAEEKVVCQLEIEGRDLETAIHRFSAASCFAKAEKYDEAITLARSALSFSLKDAHRLEIEGHLKKWLAKAKKQMRPQRRGRHATVA